MINVSNKRSLMNGKKDGAVVSKHSNKSLNENHPPHKIKRVSNDSKPSPVVKIEGSYFNIKNREAYVSDQETKEAPDVGMKRKKGFSLANQQSKLEPDPNNRLHDEKIQNVGNPHFHLAGSFCPKDIGRACQNVYCPTFSSMLFAPSSGSDYPTDHLPYMCPNMTQPERPINPTPTPSDKKKNDNLITECLAPIPYDFSDLRAHELSRKRKLNYNDYYHSGAYYNEDMRYKRQDYMNREFFEPPPSQYIQNFLGSNYIFHIPNTYRNLPQNDVLNHSDQELSHNEGNVPASFDLQRPLSEVFAFTGNNLPFPDYSQDVFVNSNNEMSTENYLDEDTSHYNRFNDS
eukprot:CAMPEP_0171458982 /NCGR_PEP_ID=MMETSP0945-20130129/4448_1 /TAXON_ID=109269 /ORGANISM="Vaucheria litorea, Strain CCMP2940" /LENGTH=344 /DNA_ID=CAMNT_0011984909 /DNA_START=150 /DNA_END=1184 /DNA_ORIENTATION=+